MKLFRVVINNIGDSAVAVVFQSIWRFLWWSARVTLRLAHRSVLFVAASGVCA